ncbi:MAG TPA: 3'-5' exonuclease [Polyangiaceae bacterium]|nr:3'-5' exonuclease [Polyangiaceae bacterium]
MAEGAAPPDAGCVQQSYLVLDIETILDPNLPILDAPDQDGLPPPPHHQIVCVGVLWLDAKYEVRRLGILGDNKDEAEMLGDLARFLDKQRPTLVTFNGRGFDLPVLASRCLRHGQSFGYYYRERDVRYRFSPDGHMDLMDFMSDFGAAKRTRLDLMARICGMPGKVGVDGKDVGPLVHAGRLEEVKNYCLCDVVQTAGVFLRVQLLRGELERATYVSAMRGLMQATLADKRVAPVAQAWDPERLLLGEPTEAEATAQA